MTIYIYPVYIYIYINIYIYIYIDEARTTHTSNFQPIACDRWPPYVLLSDRSASSLRAVRFWPVLRAGYCREGPFLSGCVFWRLLSRPCYTARRLLADLSARRTYGGQRSHAIGWKFAHVNDAYLRHVTFCIVRGPPLFIVSPISQRGPASVRGPLPTNSARLVQSPRRRRWRGWTNLQSNTTCVPYFSIM